MAFAKSFRLPTIYNAIRGAKRVGDIARFGMACSVLRAFDKLGRFPRGLVPLGDSVCRFPPVGGQGMSVVAQECCVLASLLESRRGPTHLARRISAQPSSHKHTPSGTHTASP